MVLYVVLLAETVYKKWNQVWTAQWVFFVYFRFQMSDHCWMFQLNANTIKWTNRWLFMHVVEPHLCRVCQWQIDLSMWTSTNFNFYCCHFEVLLNSHALYIIKNKAMLCTMQKWYFYLSFVVFVVLISNPPLSSNLVPTCVWIN